MSRRNKQNKASNLLYSVFIFHTTGSSLKPQLIIFWLSLWALFFTLIYFGVKNLFYFFWIVALPCFPQHKLIKSGGSLEKLNVSESLAPSFGRFNGFTCLAVCRSCTYEWVCVTQRFVWTLLLWIHSVGVGLFMQAFASPYWKLKSLNLWVSCILTLSYRFVDNKDVMWPRTSASVFCKARKTSEALCGRGSTFHGSRALVHAVTYSGTEVGVFQNIIMWRKDDTSSSTP